MWVEINPDRFVRAALVFYAGILALATLIAVLSGHPLLYAAPAGETQPVDWLRDPLVGLLAAAIVVLLSAWLTATTRWGEALARALGELLGPLSLRDCVVLAAASGVAEEALFRGALQPQLGYVGASLLFGLAHFVPRRELLPWMLFTVAAGFGLGWLYDATGNLVAPVIAHAGVNAVNLRRLTRDAAARGGPRWPSEPD
jgi:membrane protease YdiL (CAAX protease family)